MALRMIKLKWILFIKFYKIFKNFQNLIQVEKNALAEATAIAKMKDDHFELVINIQRVSPEEVKVYIDGQAVIVVAKHETDGYVTGLFCIKPFLCISLLKPNSSVIKPINNFFNTVIELN